MVDLAGTGDDGTTGLLGGGRAPKDDLRLDAYGTVDELNAIIDAAENPLADRSDENRARHHPLLCGTSEALSRICYAACLAPARASAGKRGF